MDGAEPVSGSGSPNSPKYQLMYRAVAVHHDPDLAVLERSLQMSLHYRSSRYRNPCETLQAR